MPDTALSGAQVIARALRTQGVSDVFGIVGYPIFELAETIQRAGIRFVGVRHEQTAGFAAQAIGYLRRQVGVALTTAGPGMANIVTALGNAHQNRFPLVVLSGSVPAHLNGRGAFQEAPQTELARPFCKWVGQARRVADLPRMIAAAVRHATHGRPGPAYLELPADVIWGSTAEADVDWVPPVPPPPRPTCDASSLDEATALLHGAARPLAVVGEGAVWSEASAEIREFIDLTGLPFLATPMGKGVVADTHVHSAAAARAYALEHADVIVCLGARFNWILHLGSTARFASDLQVVQIDLEAEELGANVDTPVSIVGDLKSIVGQWNDRLRRGPWQSPSLQAWRGDLASRAAARRDEVWALCHETVVPMGYYAPLHEIQLCLPPDATVVADGARPLDVSRAVIPHVRPGHRLDSGAWGAMGVGPGYAIAAALARPDKPVVALLGDSAFGFDAMAVEVSVRLHLPIIWVIFTNGGIGAGLDVPPADGAWPVHAFTRGIRHDRLFEAVGGRGTHCETPQEVGDAVAEALRAGGPHLVDLRISPTASRAQQTYLKSWRST